VSSTTNLLRRDAAARRFFAAHAQSAIGTGAANVAILVLAYDRLHSPWALTLILLADFMPGIVLSPLGGMAADHWSRRRCAVAADLIRALAFAGLALGGGLVPMLVLAASAASARAVFEPAIFAGLPGLVGPERTGAAISLYSAIHNAGQILGPGIAALVLVLAGAETVMAINAATFVVSAVLVAGLPLDRPAPQSADADTAGPTASVREALALPTVRLLLAAATATVLALGLLNVGELLLARGVLHAGNAGLAALTAAMGCGIVAASLWAGRDSSHDTLRRRFAGGIGCIAAGLLATAAAPGLIPAMAAFALIGAGSGFAVVSERRLLQELVPAALLGRVFGIERSLVTGAFAASYLVAAGLVGLAGVRALFLVAGLGVTAVLVALVAGRLRAPDLRRRLARVAVRTVAH
jgi:MFS family permease